MEAEQIAVEPQTVVAQPAQLPAAPIAAAPDPLNAIFDAWVLEQIHNSPVSRDTESFNHLITSALPDLRRRIQQGA
nr:hypothetical protein [uncultured Rhodopila sp.]